MLDAVTYWEIAAALLGIISVILSARANLWVFPTGMVSVLIYVFICHDIGLYADMGVNAYYFLMSIYGWYVWSSGSIMKNVRPVAKSTKRDALLAVLISIASFCLLYLILSSWSDSTVPLPDALTTALAIAAMWLMALKRLEHWLFWILTDVLSIALYAYKGLYFTSIQYLVFTGIAIYGYIDWKKRINTVKRS